MTLQGAPELRRRIRAISTVVKTTNRAWADETAKIARQKVRRRTGKTAASIRRRSGSRGQDVVVGDPAVNFIDAGARAHDIVPRKASVLKFTDGGAPIFAKKVHKRAQRAHPFKRDAALEGLRRKGPLPEVVKAWNEAA